ncbi:hypothetical protein B9Z19DRAFT_1061551 [Tuber borchii]|uniref:Uncharacterized protein n=1 Tax=Tuber borchii TaxID=42251 RepID=A0A2T7A543_TUBBO|nr:hypothetical protein B9Z19DRAFT_1061551 [Tuber borchii]
MAQEILQTIAKALETHEPQFLVFSELDRDVASQVLAHLEQPKYNFYKSGFRLHYSAPDRYLRLVLSTEIHGSAASWMRSEVATWFGDGRLDVATLYKILGWKTTYENFSGEYATSKKTPDLAWTPCINSLHNDYPSVVLESGPSESNTQLMRDSLVWLQGTDGAVKSVFPILEDNRPDPYITIDEFFSGSPPAGLDPEEQLPLGLRRLRGLFKGTIQQSGHLTA